MKIHFFGLLTENTSVQLRLFFVSCVDEQRRKIAVFHGSLSLLFLVALLNLLLVSKPNVSNLNIIRVTAAGLQAFQNSFIFVSEHWILLSDCVFIFFRLNFSYGMENCSTVCFVFRFARHILPIEILIVSFENSFTSNKTLFSCCYEIGFYFFF